MIVDLITFAISLIVLVKSADLVIEQVIKIARHFRISDFAAGFILIAVATSLPELAIAIVSSLSKASGISVGNVIGANITDLLLVLGILILFHVFVIRSKKLVENAQIMVFITFFPIVMLLSGTISFWGGLLLLALFAGYCIFAFKERIRLEIPPKESVKIFKTIVLFAIGAVLLFLSSKFLVSSTVSIAQSLQIPQSLIAITVISLGTTLPEFASALSAVKRKKFEIAFGDLVGSVIVNSTLVLGTAAVVSTLTFNQTVIQTSLFFLLIAELLIVGLASLQKKLDRKIGLTLISVYILFLLVEIGFVNL